MNYYIKEKNNTCFQINNIEIIKQLSNKNLENGMEVTVFGTIPHYLIVDEIKENEIYFKDELWS